jgi:ferredoxin
VKIKLDRTICDDFARCALHAPETFSLDEWNYASLIGAGNIAPDHEPGVQRALLDCPVHAITELISPASAHLGDSAT